MKILITGSSGFIGKNLASQLRNIGYKDLLLYDIDSDPSDLEQYAKEANFVFHLAGVNRPEDTKEYMEGNYGFTAQLLELLQRHNSQAPLLITSSIHAILANPYGESKLLGEEIVRKDAQERGVENYIYRLPNVFGKWCRPNYNSAVATFCNNIAQGLSIQVNDPSVMMTLIYIDDLVEEFIHALNGEPYIEGEYCRVGREYKITLGEIVNHIYSFKDSRNTLEVPDMRSPIIKKLYATYLSYLPTDSFSYDLKMNIDNRGSFTEFIKSADRGQVSINISKPGITKGEHWHHTKSEKFLVVSGRGVIRFRRIDSEQIIEYHVSGEKLQVVDIPTGYTHNIENLGSTDMVTVMWVNEIYDPTQPDTFFAAVAAVSG